MEKRQLKQDWYLDDSAVEPSRTRSANLLSDGVVKNVEDLPVLLTPKEAAVHLKCKPKYAAVLMKQKIVESRKIRGRWFTTPEWIAEYIRREMKRHG